MYRVASGPGCVAQLSEPDRRGEFARRFLALEEQLAELRAWIAANASES